MVHNNFISAYWSRYQNIKDKEKFLNLSAEYIEDRCKRSGVEITTEELKSVVERLFDVLNIVSNSGKWSAFLDLGDKNDTSNATEPSFGKRSNIITGDRDAEHVENLSTLTTIRERISLGSVQIYFKDWAGRAIRGPEITFSLDTKNKSLNFSVVDSVAKDGIVKTKMVYYYLPASKYIEYSGMKGGQWSRATMEGLINSIISTRVDPFHVQAADNHNNGDFGYIKDDVRRKLFQYYYTKNAATPHAHFSTKTQIMINGNNSSHAINYRQVAKYIRDCIDAYQKKGAGKGSEVSNNGICSCERLLKEDLDMPFLGLINGGAQFDSDKFFKTLIEKVIEPIKRKKEQDRTEDDKFLIKEIEDKF